VEGKSLTITGQVSNVAGAITNFEFYINNALVGNRIAAPYTNLWANIPRGTNYIYGRAYSDLGAVGFSPTNAVYVDGPPTIAITSPANNAVFPVGAPVNLNAVATDLYGGVTNVQFFNGATLIGSGQNSQVTNWSFAWLSAPIGTNTLTAVARDTGGLSATSSPVLVKIASIPQVLVVYPTNGAAFVAGTSLTVTATVANVAGTVTNVEFYLNSIKVGSDSSAPYTYAWTSIPAGSYTLYALARSDLGPVGQSPLVSVFIDGPPTITILTPVNMAQPPAPATIRLTAIAQDDVGVTNVTYFMFGTNSLGSRTSSPYTLLTTALPQGRYWFHAVAKDIRGQTGISQTVTNDVQPQRPVVDIILPQMSNTFAYGQPILVQAKATDLDGTVTNVVFRIGNTPFGTNSIQVSNVFSFLWSNAPLVASTNIFAVATDNDGLSRTSAPVTILIPGCSPAGVSNVVLNTNSVIGGGIVYGTVILSNAATSGGEAVLLSSSSASAIVPGWVFIPAGARSNTFTITTIPVVATNYVTIGASYRNGVTKTASLTNRPNFQGGSGPEKAVRFGFASIPYDPVDDDVTMGPIDIGFPVLYYCQLFTNLFVNMNGT